MKQEDFVYKKKKNKSTQLLCNIGAHIWKRKLENAITDKEEIWGNGNVVPQK